MRAIPNIYVRRGDAHRSAAFTLIELLAVISIIALLLAILLPSLSSARQTAKAQLCLSHLKGIGNLLAIYLDENESRFPPARLEQPSASSPPEEYYVNDAQRAAPRWQWFLEAEGGPVIDTHPFSDHIESLKFFYDGSPSSDTVGGAMQITNDLFTCPMLTDDKFARHIRDGAYGYNYQYLGNAYREHRPKRWDNFAVGRQLIRNPGMTIMVADSRGAGIRHGFHSFTLDPPRMAIEVRAQKFGPRTSVFDPPGFKGFDLDGLDEDIFSYSPVEPRHKNLGNLMFADMHGEAMRLAAIGYQLNDGSIQGIPNGVPIPIHDPSTGTYTANNRFFSGDGSDPIAEAHKQFISPDDAP